MIQSHPDAARQIAPASRSATEATRRRLQDELAELAKMVASAPDGHPAKVACHRLDELLESVSARWLSDHRSASARTLANAIARDDLPAY